MALTRWALWFPIAATIFTADAGAADGVAVNLRGAGATSCSEWISHRKADTNLSQAQWVLGYWTGFQTRARHPERFSTGSNDEVLQRVDAMCAANKDENIGAVLNALAVLVDSGD